jgi:nucleolar protein 15
MTEKAWDKRVEREEERRAKKKEALKSMGYEFEAPKLKSAKDVVEKSQQALAIPTDGEADAGVPKAIEATRVVDDHTPAAGAAEPTKGPEKDKGSKRKSTRKLDNSALIVKSGSHNSKKSKKVAAA